MQADNFETMNIREIANCAGVSPSTVSRYLNGKIQKKRRHEKLERIINECGYQLPRLKHKTRVLFVKVEEHASAWTHTSVVEERLQEFCRESGVEMFGVCGTDQREIERKIAELNISGVITVAVFQKFSVPAVIVNSDNYYGSLSCVNCDNHKGVVAGLEYLKRMGHDRVAYFCDRLPGPAFRDPRHFFMPQAYHLAGLEYDPDLVWGVSFAPREHQPVIEAAVRHFLSLKRRPTAIFMCGDTYAISFYDALKANGLRFPTT